MAAGHVNIGKKGTKDGRGVHYRRRPEWERFIIGGRVARQTVVDQGAGVNDTSGTIAAMATQSTGSPAGCVPIIMRVNCRNVSGWWAA